MRWKLSICDAMSALDLRYFLRLEGRFVQKKADLDQRKQAMG